MSKSAAAKTYVATLKRYESIKYLHDGFLKNDTNTFKYTVPNGVIHIDNNFSDEKTFVQNMTEEQTSIMLKLMLSDAATALAEIELEMQKLFVHPESEAKNVNKS